MLVESALPLERLLVEHDADEGRDDGASDVPASSAGNRLAVAKDSPEELLLLSRG